MKQVQAGKTEAQKSTLSEAKDIVSTFAINNNIDKNMKPEEYGKLHDIAMVEWERMKDDKNITVKEMRARIYSSLKNRGTKTTKTEHTVFGVPFWPSSENKTISDNLSPDLTKVPYEYRQEFRKQFKANKVINPSGRPATLAEENAQMERLISSGKIKLPE
jgi:hypothetical protein